MSVTFYTTNHFWHHYQKSYQGGPNFANRHQKGIAASDPFLIKRGAEASPISPRYYAVWSLPPSPDPSRAACCRGNA